MTTGQAVLLALVVGASCGGKNTVHEVPATTFVGGTYDTAVRITANSCGSGVVVEPRQTIVTHTAGASSFSLNHALDYTGTLQSGGAFITAAKELAGNPVTRITITGQFAIQGFEADVRVQLDRTAGADCEYTVHWTGTKLGEPNRL